MKRFMKSAMAGLLALLMLIQTADSGIAYAVGELEKALNPAEQIELTVPERFQDGNNWFFIPEQGYTASEKSAEKLYIPIQRAGDLDTEAEITLKVSDISARHDVNYKVELYKDRTEPEIVLDDQSVVDLILNADGQIEYEAVESESEFGEIINAVGEAEIVDGEGNVVGTVTATPLDEDGNPIMEAEEVVTEAAAPEEAEAEAATEEAVTEAEAIRRSGGRSHGSRRDGGSGGRIRRSRSGSGSRRGNRNRSGRGRGSGADEHCRGRILCHESVEDGESGGRELRPESGNRRRDGTRRGSRRRDSGSGGRSGGSRRNGRGRNRRRSG